MADIEKVIKGLETCIPMKYETNEEKECRHEQCPYGRENYKPMNGCFWDLMSDALELLKVQKEELYKLDRENQLMLERMAEQPQIVRCKDCKHWYPLTKTCNNVDGACCQSYVADDWFCADGELS